MPEATVASAASSEVPADVVWLAVSVMPGFWVELYSTNQTPFPSAVADPRKPPMSLADAARKTRTVAPGGAVPVAAFSAAWEIPGA